jgi:hypothetical protein
MTYVELHCHSHWSLLDGASSVEELVLGRERLAVAAVQDRWRIDDEWWRTRPVSRLYFSLLLEDGRVMRVYRDLVSGQWFQQKS